MKLISISQVGLSHIKEKALNRSKLSRKDQQKHLQQNHNTINSKYKCNETNKINTYLCHKWAYHI